MKNGIFLVVFYLIERVLRTKEKDHENDGQDEILVLGSDRYFDR